MAIIDDGFGIRVVCGSCSKSYDSCTCDLRCVVCHGRVDAPRKVYHCTRCLTDVQAEKAPYVKPKPTQQELIEAMDKVLEMENDVLNAIECKSQLRDEHEVENCGDEPDLQVCDHCLAQNRFSERVGYMRSLLERLRA